MHLIGIVQISTLLSMSASEKNLFSSFRSNPVVVNSFFLAIKNLDCNIVKSLFNGSSVFIVLNGSYYLECKTYNKSLPELFLMTPHLFPILYQYDHKYLLNA